MTIMTKAAVRAAYDREVARYGAGQAAIEATAQRLALPAEAVAEAVGPLDGRGAEELDHQPRASSAAVGRQPAGAMA